MNTKIGQENINNQGCMMRIIAYRNAKDIDVQFEDGTIVTNKCYSAFKKGEIKNLNVASVCGVGFIGYGSYSKKSDLKAYETWRSMIQRCYDAKYQSKQPTYVGCTTCDEWLCFQTFANWFYNNYYEIEGQRIQLDKDILVKNNKVYSPDTSVFVPQNINELFTKNNAKRGTLPIGVSYHKQNNKYHAKSSDGSNNTIHLGYYESPEEAFEAYKVYKEQLIKDTAEEYKDIIPDVLYEAMMNYTVNIED